MDHLLKKRIEKFEATGHSRYIYQNKLDKACFQREMAHEDFKNLLRRKASDKVLRDKVFNIAKNPKYDGCHILGPLMETSLTFNEKYNCMSCKKCNHVIWIINSNIKIQLFQKTFLAHEPMIKESTVQKQQLEEMKDIVQ